MKKEPKIIITIFIIIAAVTLRLVFASSSLHYLDVNSDESLNFLLAKHIAQNNAPLLFWTQPYQFPIEAYIISHFTEILPQSRIGIRLVQISLCCISVICFCAIFPFLGQKKDTWVKDNWLGLLLVLFPSAYVLTRQVAYLTPQHSSMLLFAALLPLTAALAMHTKRKLFWSAMGGLLAGLALSNHLLSFSVTFMIALSICLGTNFKNAVKNTILFSIFFLIGFSPFLLAKFYNPWSLSKSC